MSVGNSDWLQDEIQRYLRYFQLRLMGSGSGTPYRLMALLDPEKVTA